MTHPSLSRRTLLAAGLGGGIQLALPNGASAADTKVVIKLDWLMSNGQIGDVMALERGYFEEAGLEVELSPGGPSSATVHTVMAGQATLGQLSESTQLVAARASGLPVKIIACGFRKAPYALASLPAAPVRTAADMLGKRIGIQPTVRVVIDAIIAKHELDATKVTIVDVGFDKTPLARGEVDAIGGRVTDTQALSIFGPERIDLLTADMGLPSYANVYFATDRAIARNAVPLGRFIGAVAKGWGWTKANPKEAVQRMVEAYPDLDLEGELATIDLVLALSFDQDTARYGWGTFDPAAIEEQIAMFDALKQYRRGRPRLADVYSTTILDMTTNIRPKI